MSNDIKIFMLRKLILQIKEEHNINSVQDRLDFIQHSTVGAKLQSAENELNRLTR